jgi:hypothetical protein
MVKETYFVFTEKTNWRIGSMPELSTNESFTVVINSASLPSGGFCGVESSFLHPEVKAIEANASEIIIESFKRVFML